jgi:hypothetical protein
MHMREMNRDISGMHRSAADGRKDLAERAASYVLASYREKVVGGCGEKWCLAPCVVLLTTESLYVFSQPRLATRIDSLQC